MTDARPPRSDETTCAAGAGEVPEDSPVSRSVIDTVVEAGAVVEAISVDPPEVLRPVAGGRHEARERAVHLLYESEIKDLPIDDLLAAQVLVPEEYTERLVRGVAGHRDRLDEVIGRLARGWTLARMPTLDLVILRVACFELAEVPEVPRGVVLSEAVDLAGRYGTDDSSRFVNGLLSSAADELRPA